MYADQSSVEEHWDEDKYRMENKFDNGVQDVEDFPDDAARWTGQKVRMPNTFYNCISLELMRVYRSAKSKASPKTSITTTTKRSTASRISGIMLWMTSKMRPRKRRAGSGIRSVMLTGLEITWTMRMMREGMRAGMMTMTTEIAKLPPGDSGMEGPAEGWRFLDQCRIDRIWHGVVFGVGNMRISSMIN